MARVPDFRSVDETALGCGARQGADGLGRSHPRYRPALEIIVLIANVSEEIAFLGQGDNPAHRHGEYLQAKALTRILKAGGPERVGLFTMARDEAAEGAEDRYSDSRGTAFGSGLIHIHAKLLIADDDACLISSANINGRSFHWDTELGFLWWQPDGAIAAFRRDLWSRLSGGALADDAGLAEWRSLADHNRLAEPGDRKEFVIPYQRARAAVRAPAFLCTRQPGLAAEHGRRPVYSATSSTVSPTLWTSRPIPATVLQADKARLDTASVSTMNFDILILLSGGTRLSRNG